METIVTLLVPVLMSVLLIRMLFLPLQLAWKLLFHSGAGLVCLGIGNLISGLTGFFFPINAVTVLTAGFLGIPGMGLMAIVQML